MGQGRVSGKGPLDAVRVEADQRGWGRAGGPQEEAAALGHVTGAGGLIYLGQCGDRSGGTIIKFEVRAFGACRGSTYGMWELGGSQG